jgi:hypothetical protein
MTSVDGVVVAGHRVASGDNADPRFPGGTIAMQIPHFLAAGIDLRPFHPATINLRIGRYRIGPDAVTLRDVRWHPTEPAEDFSFLPCRISRRGGDGVDGLVYHPHPATKPEHHQPDDVIEILAPFLPGLTRGDILRLEVPDGLEMVLSR